MREPAVVVVPGAPKRDSETVGHVSQRELLEADQLEGLALLFGQARQTRRDHPSALVTRQFPAFRGQTVGKFAERCSGVRGASLERCLAAERPVIGVLEQPHANGTARRVVLGGFAEDFEEDFLRDVFRFRGIAEDIGRHSMYERRISMDQGGKRVSARRAHPVDEIHVWSSVSLTELSGRAALPHRSSSIWRL